MLQDFETLKDVLTAINGACSSLPLTRLRIEDRIESRKTTVEICTTVALTSPFALATHPLYLKATRLFDCSDQNTIVF